MATASSSTHRGFPGRKRGQRNRLVMAVGGAAGVRVMGELLPDLLGDERNEGVQHPEYPIVDLQQDRNGRVARLARGLQMRLDELDVPIGVFVPEKVEQPVSGDVEPKRVEGVPDRPGQLAHAMQNPPMTELQLGDRRYQRSAPGVTPEGSS